MKQNSKKALKHKQKQILESISSAEGQYFGFQQQQEKPVQKQSNSSKPAARYSENLKKISTAYGGLVHRNDHKNSITKQISVRKNESEFKKNNSAQSQPFVDEKPSAFKSMKSIEPKKLNDQILGSDTVTFEDSVHINQKFCSIQPKQFRIQSKQSKRNGSSPPNKIQQEKIDENKKLNKELPQKNVDKQKLKQIYDKIRNPDHKGTRVTAESQNQNQKLIIRQSPYKIHPRGKNENDQSSRRSPSKTIRKIQEPRSTTKINGQQLLNGKISIIWIFCLKDQTNEKIKNRIIEMYNPLVDDDKAVPLVSNPKKVRDFVNIPNCYFKIVTDLENAEAALGYRIYSTVIQFYIYNEHGNQSLLKALEFKSVTRKVKGIFTDWEKVLNRAQDQIQEEISIYNVNNGFQKRQRQRKFPNFLKLTDTDKTQATLYRINLYGSIKLISEQKRQSYDDFMRLVLSKYGQKQQQQHNIQDYIQIDHLKPTASLTQAKLIIQFYVRQSFYYQVVNSMLRTMKTSEQFKPCILPFNQTYHSIKMYYQRFLKQSSFEIPQMILYRGCKIMKRDFAQLKPGTFIQMFGFMSTSKSQERAQDFVDRDGYLFVIHVKKRSGNFQKFKNFDHGFVDINKYGLASDQFKKQEQVLFNALNVYRVQKIEEKNDYTYIHLEYGVTFQLLEKPKQKLTQDQYQILINYHYCTKILGKIQDQGDVFLFANQLIQAKQYYDKKIKQGNNLAHNYYKLASVQKQCGQIDDAQKNANNALKLYGDQIDKSDRDKCLKVFGIHSKNAQISLDKQDYLTADQSIDRALELLSDQDLFEKGVKLRERGQIKFKKGQIQKAQNDFEQSESIFQNIRDQGRIRKVTAYKTFYLSHFSLFCSDKTRDDLKNQLKQQLTKVQQLQRKVSQVNQDIEEEMIKINKSLKDVSLYVQDRQKYEIYVKKAQSYLFSIQARKANDPQLKAKLLSMQAMIADYQQLAQSQRLMYEAIRLIEQKNPFDMKVADYSKILAKMQKAELQKYTNPGKHPINVRPTVPIPYDSVKRQQIYQRCKQNFAKTLNVLLYHAKDKACPQILDIRNQLGQLTFGQNDYAECQKIIKQAREGNEKVVHSQMSKTLVIMAKICFARGQLKNSFETLNQAYKVLEEAMVKKHHKQNQSSKIQKYQNIFQNSDTYLLIKFIRINIYHKQKNHDLALKNIEQVHSIITKKVGVNDSHPMLADLLEAKGTFEVYKGNIYGFDQFFEKSIQLREKQFGYYHPVNAKSYCSYAKFLIMVKDYKRAEKMLEKAVQIISAFEQSNPHYWAIYYSQGFYNEDVKIFDKSQAYYQKSLIWSQKYFNKSHIAIKQIMLRYANSLNKSQKIQQSIKLYENLEQELDDGIRQSNKRSEIDQQIDDEKVSLKKLMYTQLSQIQSQELTKNESYVSTTHNNLINTSLYKSKLNFLRNTYHLRELKNERKFSEFEEQK